MYRILRKKIKEALISVAPVTVIVWLLNLTPLVQFDLRELLLFSVCALLLVVGIALFNLGADLAMTPMGEHIGAGLVRSKRVSLLLSVGFAMGVLITVAEPDLSVLAAQVSNVLNGTLLIATVGIGVGLFLLLSIVKMLLRKPLSAILQFFYFVIFAVAALLLLSGNERLMALAFDSGGVTTGPITVPFLMALGVGIATTLGGRNAQEISFGLVALCSIGPVLAVLFLGLFMRGELTYTVPEYSIDAHLGEAFLPTVLETTKDVGGALGLVVLFFFVLQIAFLRLPYKKILQIGVGILYTFFGLVIFLTAVAVGFMPIGYKLGVCLAQDSPVCLVIAGFVLGVAVVLAEPAVHVLKAQVEEVTEGSVSKASMMIALSVGVGISIGLSMLRIALGFHLLYYLIPGYFLSLGLSFFVPGLYTAIAFDSGGVASGPLTSSFILPLAIGACCAVGGEANVLTDAFGVVAMVAMTPLITIQLLGFRAVVSRQVKASIALRQMLSAEDEQIIRFE